MRTSPKAHEDSWGELYEDIASCLIISNACDYFNPTNSAPTECVDCACFKLKRSDQNYDGMDCAEAMAQHIIERAMALGGVRSCRMDRTEEATVKQVNVRIWKCSECGRECEELNGAYQYCPHCGAKTQYD